jgi:phenylacetate-CoA ligase
MGSSVDQGSPRKSTVKDSLLKVYHHAPYPLKVLAASTWGYYLRWWRYGPGTQRLVAEAREREYWSPQQWQTWQENRLGYVLHRAVTQVPYYREQWAERRRRGDRTSWEYLENWPILEKEPLRQNSKAFVADDCKIQYMIEDHTTGTTGTPLTLWASQKTMRAWYALFEARWRRWYGVNHYDKWGHIGGQLIIPVEKRNPPFWVWNSALHQLYLSSYHLAPDLIPFYLDALKHYKIKYILGYASSLYALALSIIQLKRDDLQMVVAISDGEPLFDHQRKIIKEAFRCPARATYGMAETVVAASECDCGYLHLWPETGMPEFFENDVPVADGCPGDIVSTGLLNTDMPLIRYRVGDRGISSMSETPCLCHRTLPRIDTIEGRVDDFLFTNDGRRVGRLSQVLKNKPVIEGQFIQESLENIRLRFIPASEYTEEANVTIIESLKARMGNVKLTLEPVTEIPRNSRGKFRSVICNLSPEEIAKIKSIDIKV